MYQFKVCKLRKRGKSKRRLKINFFINRQFVASFLNVEIASVSTITIVSHIVLDLVVVDISARGRGMIKPRPYHEFHV